MGGDGDVWGKHEHGVSVCVGTLTCARLSVVCTLLSLLFSPLSIPSYPSLSLDISSVSYTASSCALTPDTTSLSRRVCCDVAAGIGVDMRWRFIFTKPTIPGVAAIQHPILLLSEMTVLSEGVTSYDGPVITELKGATGMSTSGGDTVDIFGNNLGVAGGAGTGKGAVARYDNGEQGDVVVTGIACTMEPDPTSAAYPIFLRCTSGAGFGGPRTYESKLSIVL